MTKLQLLSQYTAKTYSTNYKYHSHLLSIPFVTTTNGCDTTRHTQNNTEINSILINSYA